MNNITLTADVNSKVGLVKNIANKTRGPYTPEKYGNVIIPMAIIRRFDCILADKNAEILKVITAASKVKGMTPEKMEEMVKKHEKNFWKSIGIFRKFQKTFQRKHSMVFGLCCTRQERIVSPMQVAQNRGHRFSKIDQCPSSKPGDLRILPPASPIL